MRSKKNVTLFQDDEEDMKLYCQKVESQKQLREKFVQMKEEQRLKNQMQNFIQNNIKGNVFTSDLRYYYGSDFQDIIHVQRMNQQ